MTNWKTSESFKWLPPGELKVGEGVGNRVTIKGKALFAGAVSRNLKKYVKEELVRAARTLQGKPLTINHDPKRIAGHVMLADEEEETIEYAAEINDKTVVGREFLQKMRDRKTLNPEAYFKKWHTYPVTGVSVEADYLFSRCTECGERLLTPEQFNEHMRGHGKIVDVKQEPRGIYFKALSLVEPPEVPGVPGTTVELAETAQGMSRLIEILVNDVKEKTEYMQKKPATETPTELAVGPVPKLQVKEVMLEKHEQPTPPKTEAPAITQAAIEKQKEQIRQEIMKPITLEVASPKRVILKESCAFEKLALAEPCDWSKFGYASFEDCVASNSDKGDPEAYCGSLKAKEKLEIARYNKLVEAFNKLVDEIQKPIEGLDYQPVIESLKEIITQLNETLRGHQPAIDGLKESLGQCAEALAKAEANFAALPKDDVTWQPKLEAQETLHQKLDERISDATQKIDALEHDTRINDVSKKVEALETKHALLNEVYGKLQKDHTEYVTATEAKLKEKDTKIKEVETKLQENKDKKLKETEELTARVDNLEHNQKAQFAGHAPNPKKQSEEPGSTNLQKLQRGR